MWDVPTEIRVITTNGFVKRNGECVMGAGCAKEANERFPGLALKLGRYIKQYGNRCFRLGDGLASFPVKHHWKEQADLELIKKSCGELMAMADKFSWNDVLLPRPGCGNGRLTWEEVKPVISELLDDRVTVIIFEA